MANDISAEEGLIKALLSVNTLNALIKKLVEKKVLRTDEANAIITNSANELLDLYGDGELREYVVKAVTKLRE